MKLTIDRFVLMAGILCLSAHAQLAAQSAPELEKRPAPIATPASDFDVAPGLKLPAHGMVFALDTAAKPHLVKLDASELLLNRHTASNFAKSQFYVGSRQTLEISGTAPKAEIESPGVSFFVRLNADEPSLAISRLTLVRLEVVGQTRVAAALDANVFGGGAKRKIQAVEVGKEELPDGEWVKVTPSQNLALGHYAIIFFPKDPKLFPSTAYDFRVIGAAQ